MPAPPESRNAAEDPDRQRAVAEYFSKNAPAWKGRYGVDGAPAPQNAWEYRKRGRIALAWLTKLRSQYPEARMLEIGCGAGVHSTAAAKAGWHVVAADIAPGMLAEAKAQSTQPAWIAATAEAPPFRPQSFDVVMMNGVIGYLADPVGVLRIVQSLLRPGGRLIISWVGKPPQLFTRVSDAASAIPERLYLSLKRMLKGARTSEAAPPGFYEQFLKRSTPDEMYAMLESTGFAVEDVRSQNFGRVHFMGKSIWAEAVDIKLSELTEAMLGGTPRRGLRRGSRTHIALVRRV